MLINGRPVSTSPVTQAVTRQTLFRFDPFEEDKPDRWALAMGSSQLNADVKPFVPPTGSHAAARSSESATEDRGSSPSNGDSTESK